MKRFLFGRGLVAQSILGRIALIVLYATVWSILLAWLFLLGEPPDPVMLKFAVLAAIGVGAGILARRILRSYSLTLSFLTALLAEIVALTALNPVTHGFLGANLLGLYPSVPEWDGLLQFCVSGLASWLVLRAWSSPVEIRPAKHAASARPVRSARAPERRASRKGPSSRARARSPRKAAASSPRVSLTQLSQRASQKLRASVKPLGALLARPLSILAGGSAGTTVRPKARPGKRRRPGSPMRVRRKSRGVQLSRTVEHRCPYCLEPVLASDPRGIKICEVCHTRHHADCWSVTGVCQVPHQNH